MKQLVKDGTILIAVASFSLGVSVASLLMDIFQK